MKWTQRIVNNLYELGYDCMNPEDEEGTSPERFISSVLGALELSRPPQDMIRIAKQTLEDKMM